MSEFRFLHLERRRIDQALPDILEEALAAGWRVVVQAGSEERVEALNERLWTYADESFLPHGSARDGEPQAQPIYLTAGDDNPNGARLARAALRRSRRRFRRSRLRARRAAVRRARRGGGRRGAASNGPRSRRPGAAPSYWREGEDGGWARVR